MSLFIRVFTNFYSHRKTAKLRAALGNDALWVPPRLWAYASENQPDGDFSGYSASEIAMLIGYTGDAQAMLQALLQAGFLDSDLKIHDWSDHNSYHATYKERAKNAAKARWAGQDKTGDRQDKTGQEASIATSIAKHCYKHNGLGDNGYISEVSELIQQIGFTLYGRPEDQSATYEEERGALEVVKRPKWKSEKEEMLSFGRILDPQDSQFNLPKGLVKLFQNWSSCLDVARTYRRREKSNKPQSRPSL